jgi:two-component system alkaline phosphatase synthesis response regulator PhoP
VVLAGDGPSGLTLAQTELPDLIVLDLNLPGLDGLQLCQSLRTHHRRAVAATPIIMVTARAEEEERLTGLELGADDYLTKPFSPKELVARAKAIFRRLERETGQLHKDGELVLDTAAHIATLAGHPLELTPHEFAILSVLLEHRGQALSRSQLIELALGHDYDGLERTVDVHIRNLRRKIEGDPAQPQRIVTVFGLGYRYEA